MNRNKLNPAHLMHLSQYAEALATGFIELIKQQEAPLDKKVQTVTAAAIHRLLSVTKQVDVAVQLCHETRKPKRHVIDNMLHMITGVEQELTATMRELAANGGPVTFVS